MLAIEILRIYFLKHLGVLKGDFWGFGSPKDAPLAKKHYFSKVELKAS